MRNIRAIGAALGAAAIIVGTVAGAAPAAFAGTGSVGPVSVSLSTIAASATATYTVTFRSTDLLPSGGTITITASGGTLPSLASDYTATAQGHSLVPVASGRRRQCDHHHRGGDHCRELDR